jgi:hypothetical protein
MGDLKRAENDWYVDQPEATEALLRAERFSGSSWDPACGLGTIPKALRDAGKDCFGSDLVDRGFPGVALLNFLTDEPEGAGQDVDNIVTNPPFNLARAFADKALTVAAHKVAFLLPLTFLEGQRKGPWLKSTPLARVHVFTWRISMPPGELLVAGTVKPEGGKKCFAWFVWEHGWQGPPVINLLIKPDAKVAA